MGIFSAGNRNFFGLDIGTSAIRVVQMKGGNSKVLVRYGSIDIDPRIVASDANADQQKLAHAIKEVIAKTGISTPNVAVGVPSGKTFITVADFDRLSMSELDRTIKLQADSLIPTPLAESKLDWALLGDSPVEQSKIEVLLSSVSNAYVESRLDLLESLGLDVVAFEPDSIALARSLMAPDDTSPQLLIDIGSETSDLVIVLNGAPRLIRAIPTGMNSFLKAAEQNLGIDAKQAEQFLFKFGLSKDKLEGQIHGAIIGSVDVLVGEIEKSIKFFNTRYKDGAIQKIVVTGGASTLPEFPLYIANKFNMNVEIGNAWRNVSFPSSVQNDLLAVSNRFSIAAGLAERKT